MADLKVGETYIDRVFITSRTTGLGVTGLSPTCYIIANDGTRTAGTVAEMTNGWYKVTDFTPTANGTWCTEWGGVNLALYTIQYPYKEFKVGGGILSDVYDTRCFKVQPPININQAPTQNVPITVLDTTLNCRVIGLTLDSGSDNPTYSVSIIIDGQTITGSDNITASTHIHAYIHVTPTGPEILFTTSNAAGDTASYLCEGESVKITVTKTSAGASGNLLASCLYAIK